MSTGVEDMGDALPNDAREMLAAVAPELAAQLEHGEKLLARLRDLQQFQKERAAGETERLRSMSAELAGIVAGHLNLHESLKELKREGKSNGYDVPARTPPPADQLPLMVAIKALEPNEDRLGPSGKRTLEVLRTRLDEVKAGRR